MNRGWENDERKNRDGKRMKWGGEKTNPAGLAPDGVLSLSVGGGQKQGYEHDSPGGCPPRSIPRTILRKEVIQPQVPLRLPCYDLVPIDRFAFGAGLVRRLRALRSFVA